ncbi:MAG: hypothetical protein R3261_11835, partial [Alphaproteobacteria bacterium]|nr:hypothetical protein [Alphaproteobacteria bacterium]
DNYLILAPSEDEAMAATEALRSALKSHLAGPLELIIKQQQPVSKTFHFLGYKYQQNTDGYYVKPTNEKLKEFDRKFRRLLKPMLNLVCAFDEDSPQLQKLHNMMRGWQNAYRLWPDVDKFISDYHDDIEVASNAYILNKLAKLK